MHLSVGDSFKSWRADRVTCTLEASTLRSRINSLRFASIRTNLVVVIKYDCGLMCNLRYVRRHSWKVT